jgi:hypothetical protein
MVSADSSVSTLNTLRPHESAYIEGEGLEGTQNERPEEMKPPTQRECAQHAILPEQLQHRSLSWGCCIKI